MRIGAIIFLLLSLSSHPSFGQGKYGETEEDSIECIRQLNLYRDFRDNNEFKKALPYWKRSLELCPRASKRLYLDGEDFYEALIEEARDSVRFVELVDSLMWVFDERIEYFGEEAKVTGNKGEALVKMRKQLPPERLEKGNKYLEEAVKELKADAYPSHIGYYYFSLYFLRKDGKVTRSKILLEYLPISKYVRNNIEASVNDIEKLENELESLTSEGKKGEEYKEKMEELQKKKRYKQYFRKVESQVNKIFLNQAKCDTLEKLYGNLVDKEELDFEEDLYGSHIFREELTGDDSSSIGPETKRHMMLAMKKRGCKDNELFPRIAKSVHEEDPSSESAFEIGVLEMEKEDHEEAGEYFEEAIELATEGDTVKVSQDRLLEYYIAAGRNANDRGQYSKGAEYGRKALEIADEGRAYVIIADAIAKSSSSCGDNKIERGAHYWLAVDYLQKASKDTSIEDVVNSKMGSYRSRFPDKTTMFEHGLLDSNEEPVDQPFEIGCWINESTRPRRSW